jgi:RNA polymerase sigma-70 factor (ECF subfamily)
MAVTREQLFEQTLVVRSQLGDEAAFTELLKLHAPRLLRFTQRMMQSSPEQVADVTQEIWVAIFRALPRLADAGKFQPWAFRIARDCIYREYRRRSMEPHAKDVDEMTHTSDAAAELEELRHCLTTISPEHRQVLMLRFFDDLSYEEIARLTGSSVGTIRSRIHYGKRALRIAWKGRTP